MARTDTLDPARALERRARRRVHMKMGWLLHAFVFVVVNIGLFALNQATGGHRWFVFPLSGWALGLAIHGTVVLLVTSSDGWRSRMVRREMARMSR